MEGPDLANPDLVREEYASETRLLARRAAQRFACGPDAEALAFELVAAVEPAHVLEVGCGTAELSDRIARELGADVSALDISPRMVELARRRGLRSFVGDVQSLSFDDGSFDCVVAAWMLYHVRDVEQALTEIRRVLRPDGRLVAVTNHRDHMLEVRRLVGIVADDGGSFSGEVAPSLLRRHFRTVTQFDATGSLTFPDAEALNEYLSSWIALGPKNLASVGEVTFPFRVRRRPIVLVGDDPL